MSGMTNMLPRTLRGPAPQTKGVRMHRDRADPSGLLLGSDVSARHEPGRENDDLGTHWLPETVYRASRNGASNGLFGGCDGAIREDRAPLASRPRRWVNGPT